MFKKLAQYYGTRKHIEGDKSEGKFKHKKTYPPYIFRKSATNSDSLSVEIASRIESISR